MIGPSRGFILSYITIFYAVRASDHNEVMISAVRIVQLRRICRVPL